MTIRKIFLLTLAFAILLATNSIAQSENSKEKAALTVLLHDFLIGASENDVQMHDRFWAEDLIYTSSAGKRFGKSQLMAGLSKEPDPDAAMATYSAEDIVIQVYNDMAVVAFKLVGKVVIGLETEVSYYLNSGTFVKREGKWKAVNWQATKATD